MKRETKKVTRKATKKAAKRPARKRVRPAQEDAFSEEINFTFEPFVPPAPRKVDVHYPEVWGEEVGRAAKVLGVDPLEVQAKLSELLPKHYPNHLRILEAIVEQEKAAIEAKCRPYQDAEQAAHLGGKKVLAAEQKRIVDLEEKIRERREIVEPNVALFDGTDFLTCGPQIPAARLRNLKP